MHLVIGAHGYAGSHAVSALREHVRVRCAEPGEDLAAAMRRVEVVHVAVDLHSPFERLRWRRGRTPDALLVQVVAQARAAGVRRIVYLSPISVYGFTRDGRVSERTALRPEHPYERLVARDEGWLREREEPEVVVLRAAQGFGAGEPVLTRLLQRMAVARLLLPAGGRARRTFLAGADLGRAVAAAGLRGEAGAAYLAGGFDGCWWELLEAAALTLGVTPRLTWLAYDFAYLAASSHAAPVAEGGCCPTPFMVDLLAKPQTVEDGWSRRELGWEPRITSFAAGLGDLAEWYEGALAAEPATGPGAPRLA